MKKFVLCTVLVLAVIGLSYGTTSAVPEFEIAMVMDFSNLNSIHMGNAITATDPSYSFLHGTMQQEVNPVADPVPEPAIILLMGAGLMVVARTARKNLLN